MKNHNRSLFLPYAGFALTELVFVLAIMTIILSISIPSYNSWQRKYNIESQVRTMVADISELRLQAMTQKRRHSITINANSYVFRSYSSDALASGTGPVSPGGTRTVSYRLMSNAGTSYAGTILEIDPRGLLVSLPATIYLDAGNTSTSLNCLTIHTARVNPGWSATIGGGCNDR